MVSVPRVVVFCSIAAVFMYGIHWKFQEENIPYTVVSSFGEYKQTKELLKDQLAQPIGKLLNVKSYAPEKATYVVVIGESTTRRHLQLYGYDRETNPFLSQIKDQLTVFDSVISPHVHTITALDKIMTLQSFENPKVASNVSVVQLANQAGFKTYWLSNQRAVGVFESIPTIIGSAATERYFLNGNAYNDMSFDEVLLPKYQEILNDASTQKIVFVHLMGTHVGYDKRYPSSFEYFKEPLKTKSAIASQFINQYDNAVRYNDWVIKQLIESLREQSGEKFLLYFSDHGDDVYDVHDRIGHNEYNATRPMYEVPFILWQPKDGSHFADTFNIKSRRYSLEDFEHTFAGLTKLTFDGWDSKKNIFSDRFTIKNRTIQDTINYENW
jgi:heptose-I-phosphate ethanolaminephosphotransferase